MFLPASPENDAERCSKFATEKHEGRRSSKTTQMYKHIDTNIVYSLNSASIFAPTGKTFVAGSICETCTACKLLATKPQELHAPVFPSHSPVARFFHAGCGTPAEGFEAAAQCREGRLDGRRGPDWGLRGLWIPTSPPQTW